MFYTFLIVVVAVAARFKDVVETDKVRFDISVWVGNRIAHTGLCGKIDNYIGLKFLEKSVDQCLVRYVSLYKSPLAVGMLCCYLFNLGKTEIFDCRVIIVINLSFASM